MSPSSQWDEGEYFRDYNEHLSNTCSSASKEEVIFADSLSWADGVTDVLQHVVIPPKIPLKNQLKEW